jgi:hypothetical protein
MLSCVGGGSQGMTDAAFLATYAERIKKKKEILGTKFYFFFFFFFF